MARTDDGEVVRLARLEHGVPQLDAVPACLVEVDLVAELARVAGARDEDLHSVELVGPQVVVGDLEDAVAEQVDHHVFRLRPLDLHRPDVDLLDRHVIVGVVGDAPRPQLHVAVGQRKPETVLLHAHQHGVVDDAPVRQAEEDVLALLHGALVQVAGDEQVGEVECVGPADLDLPLDPDVPQRDAVQQVPVLRDRIPVVPGVVRVVIDAVHPHAVAARRVEVRGLPNPGVQQDLWMLVHLCQGVVPPPTCRSLGSAAR